MWATLRASQFRVGKLVPFEADQKKARSNLLQLGVRDNATLIAQYSGDKDDKYVKDQIQIYLKQFYHYCNTNVYKLKNELQTFGVKGKSTISLKEGNEIQNIIPSLDMQKQEAGSESDYTGAVTHIAFLRANTTGCIFFTILFRYTETSRHDAHWLIVESVYKKNCRYADFLRINVCNNNLSQEFVQVYAYVDNTDEVLQYYVNDNKKKDEHILFRDCLYLYDQIVPLPAEKWGVNACTMEAGQNLVKDSINKPFANGFWYAIKQIIQIATVKQIVDRQVKELREIPSPRTGWFFCIHGEIRRGKPNECLFFKATDLAHFDSVICDATIDTFVENVRCLTYFYSSIENTEAYMHRSDQESDAKNKLRELLKLMRNEMQLRAEVYRARTIGGLLVDSEDVELDAVYMRQSILDGKVYYMHPEKNTSPSQNPSMDPDRTRKKQKVADAITNEINAMLFGMSL